MLRHAMIYYFSCALLVFAHLPLANTEFEDCGSALGMFTNVKVSGCDGASVCRLVKGSNVSIDIDFVTMKSIATVKVRVYGILFHIPMPFMLPNANACVNPTSNIQCPLTKGSEHTYHEVLPVSKSYPQVSVKVMWELVDENNEKIVCIIIPARIV